MNVQDSEYEERVLHQSSLVCLLDPTPHCIKKIIISFTNSHLELETACIKDVF